MCRKGSSPADCSPLTCVVGDRSYEAAVSLEIMGEAHGGLALFYDSRAFAGVGFSAGWSDLDPASLADGGFPGIIRTCSGSS